MTTSITNGGYYKQSSDLNIITLGVEVRGVFSAYVGCLGPTAWGAFPTPWIGSFDG